MSQRGRRFLGVSTVQHKYAVAGTNLPSVPKIGALVGVQGKLLGQIGQGLVVAQRSQGNLRLERRRMGTAGAARRFLDN